MTIPFGNKKAYKNLQQFNSLDIKIMFNIFKEYKNNLIFYRFADGKWSLSNEFECKNIEPLVKKDDNEFVLSAKSIVLIKFYN